jgi:hypothetical protein
LNIWALLGVLLLIVGFLILALLPVVGVAYLAIREHFSEITGSRMNALAVGSFLALGLLTIWLSLAYFGLALGQTLGNANVGVLVGGLAGVLGWIATMFVYAPRMTKALVELRASLRPQADTVDRQRRLRNWLIISRSCFQHSRSLSLCSGWCRRAVRSNGAD